MPIYPHRHVDNLRYQSTVFGWCFCYTNLSGMTRNYHARAERHRDNKLQGKERNTMKRDDIKKEFPEATDEQINRLLDINSADIGKARGNAGKLQEDLDAALETISELKANAEDSEKLKQRIAEFEQAEAERKEAEKKAAERAELEERFGAVSGKKKYIHDMVREGVLNDFGKALLDKANRGKSDAEIFDALTKDKGYFASENPPGNMGGVGNVGGDDSDALSDAEYYAKIFENKK